jgi:hypothetical protein
MILDGLSAGEGTIHMRENEAVAMPKVAPRYQSK